MRRRWLDKAAGGTALSLLAGLPASAQVLYDNGPLVTTPTGACIPAGQSSSQLQSAGGFPNGVLGVGAQLVGSTNNRVADDFTITGPAGWNISSIVFTAYASQSPTTPSPITAINLRIWNGPPDQPGSSVVFGDVTTNRLTASTFLSAYRIGATCSVARALFSCTVAVNTTLAPGTYWLDWQGVANPLFTGPWIPPVTIVGVRGKPGANAVQFVSPTWAAIIDDGPSPGGTSPPVAQDLPFLINGVQSPGPCYANCDQSTGSPLLTGNDFTCFLNSYVTNGSYANCDQSTGNPLLTGNDFTCFINAYALGCT